MSIAEKLKKFAAIASAGSRFQMRLSDGCVYAPGVGYYQTKSRRDGGVRFIIFPNSPISERNTRFPNIAHKFEISDAKKKYHKLGITTKEERIFRKNMPQQIDAFCGPSYLRKNGLIWVQPYYATSKQSVTSAVWPGVNCTFREYCDKRFPKLSPELIDFEIKNGLIAVNLQKYNENQILKEGDVITRLCHYHEKPILDRPLHIIYQDENMVVVDKPPSWPVHMCGGFRMNSLLYYMYKTLGYPELRTIHRLDRVTSGVLVIAKCSESASKLSASLKAGGWSRKQYLALVHGQFKHDHLVNNNPLTSYSLTRDVEMQFSKKGSVTAETHFTLIKYDQRTDRSLLLCRPVTGRTHQIRLHLKELGHPIVYDTLYGSGETLSYPLEDVFVRVRYKQHPTEDISKQNKIFAVNDNLEDISHKVYNDNNDIISDVTEYPDSLSETRKDDFIHDKDYDINATKDEYHDSIVSRFQYDPACQFCEGKSRHDVYEPMFICLHSLRYKIEDKVFTSKVPEWAKAYLSDCELESIPGLNEAHNL